MIETRTSSTVRDWQVSRRTDYCFGLKYKHWWWARKQLLKEVPGRDTYQGEHPVTLRAWRGLRGELPLWRSWGIVERRSVYTPPASQWWRLPPPCQHWLSGPAWCCLATGHKQNQPLVKMKQTASLKPLTIYNWLHYWSYSSLWFHCINLSRPQPLKWIASINAKLDYGKIPVKYYFRLSQYLPKILLVLNWCENHQLTISHRTNTASKSTFLLPVPKSPLAENLTPSFVQQITTDSPIWLRSRQIRWNSAAGILMTQL